MGLGLAISVDRVGRSTRIQSNRIESAPRLGRPPAESPQTSLTHGLCVVLSVVRSTLLGAAAAEAVQLSPAQAH